MDRFSSWYPNQDWIVSEILDWIPSGQKYLCLSAPTGSGKSLTAILAAKLSGFRTVILTATKGLQDQIMRDFGSMAVNVKGQNNFMCMLADVRADEGPCHSGIACSYRDNGCRYYEQLEKALASNIVVTNYAYYLAQTKYSSGLGEVDLLIADEANMAFGALESHLKVHLSAGEVGPMGIQLPRQNLDWPDWIAWARSGLPKAQYMVDDIEAKIKGLRDIGQPVPAAVYRSHRLARSVVLRLMSLSTAQGQWVVQWIENGWEFTPVWIANYSWLLFGAVNKAVLMSAFMSPKVADSLGITDYKWLETGSSFPAANTPVYHIPTARINHKADEYSINVWSARIDQIISRRLDRKGIIFTVSYRRRDQLLQRSRYAGIMVSHGTRDVVEMVRRFKAADAPVVLVSPSVTSGWDFPEDDCRYIIISKIPYPDTRDAVMIARQETDKEWSSFLAMETLVQEAGRGTRSAADRCEVFVVDDSWTWYWPRYRQFAPGWFQERVLGSLSTVPDPLI